MNKIIITVVGKDTVGIIAKVCTYLAENQVNILDISQTIVQEFFNMMMIVDMDKALKPFETVSSDRGGHRRQDQVPEGGDLYKDAQNLKAGSLYGFCSGQCREVRPAGNRGGAEDRMRRKTGRRMERITC